MAISLATEVSGAGSYPAIRFNQRERKLLESVKTYADALVAASDDLVEDLTPQLGGNLDVNGKSIVSVSNGDIAITPNGSGDVILDGLKWPQADGTAGQVLVSDGSAQLSWSSAPALSSPTLTSPVINTDVVGEVSGTLTAAQLLALKATPIELIPAPAAGKIIIVDEIEAFLDYGSAAFVRPNADEEIVFQYSGGADIWAPVVATDTFITSTADTRRMVKPAYLEIDTGVVFDPATADVEAVEARVVGTAELTTGDSDIKYKIRYRVVTLSA